MKINNKGFMLVEVVITSTVVVTAMIGLYTSFNRIYNNYRLRNSYYNIDGVYATKKMVNELLEIEFTDQNGNNTVGINSFINDFSYTGQSKYLIKNKNCDVSSVNLACTMIRELYEVNNMVFVEYDKDALEDLRDGTNIDGVENQTFQDYIDYVIEYYGIKSASDSNNKEYSYIILTELKDGENYYYSNLRMR